MTRYLPYLYSQFPDVKSSVFFFYLALQPFKSLSFLNFWDFEITHKDTPQSVELLWTSDQLVAETSTWQHTQHSQQTSMPPAGFKPAIPVGERPQTYALDRSATGIRTRNPNRRAAADPRIRPLGHWDRHKTSYIKCKLLTWYTWWF